MIALAAGVAVVSAAASDAKLRPTPTHQTALRPTSHLGAQTLGSSPGKVKPEITAFLVCGKVVATPTTVRCVPQFNLGVPTATKSVSFLVGYKGFKKGAILTFNFLTADGKEPLTNPVSGKMSYERGSIWTSFAGPFAKMTMVVRLDYNGVAFKKTYRVSFV